MYQPRSAIWELARWLLACEDAPGTPPGQKSTGAFSVCGKLRQHLSVLAGVAGFRSLLSRALALAKVEVPWLDAVRIREDGSLDWPGADESQQDAEETAEGEVALVAQLLGLLVSFIGEALTLHLVREVWPEAPFGGTDEGTEEKP
jgi:hypothetical protein